MTEIEKKLLETARRADSKDLSPDGIIICGLAATLARIIETRNTLQQPDFCGDVSAFNHKMNVGYQGPFRNLTEDLRFRLEHMDEELQELKDAIEEEDDVKALDAYIDLIYLLFGTADLQGFKNNALCEAWRRIHTSNMTKEPVPAGKGKHGSTVHKGKNFQPAVLDDIIKDTKWQG